MKNRAFILSIKNIIQIDNLTILTLISLFARMAVPGFKHVFLVFISCLICLYLYKFPIKGIFKRLINFSKNYYLFIIAIIFYCLGIILSQKVYNKTIIELTNGISIFIITFIKDEQKLSQKYFSVVFSKFMSYSSFLISIASLVVIIFFSDNFNLNTSTSLTTDSNFYGLFILLGFLSTIKLINENKINNILSNIFLFIQFVNLSLLGSRRVFIVLLIVLSVTTLLIVLRRFSLKKYITFIITSIAYIVIILFFILQPADVKRKLLPVSSRKYTTVKTCCCSLIDSYSSFFPKKITFDQAYSKLFTYTPVDSEDPETWSNKIFQGVDIDSIKTQDTILLNKKGILINCNSFFEKSEEGFFHNINLPKINIDSNEICIYSLYCFVSKDFTGHKVELYNDANKTYNKVNYDLNKKGTWQKLNLKISKSTPNNKPVFFLLKGGYWLTANNDYIIFSLFNYYVIDNKNTCLNTTTLDSAIWDYNKYKRVLQKKVPNTIIPANTTLKKLKDNVIFSDHCFIKDKNKKLFQNINVSISKSRYLTIPILNIPITPIENRDFHRLSRWEYALKLWQTKYTRSQKLFGHGFDYLEWYGEQFYKSNERLDYPHNHILSAFLYSGIIGGVFYIFLIIIILLKHVRYSDFYTKILFFIIFFFCFVSGNSFLSVPIFLFFMILPFNTSLNSSNK